MNKPVGGRGHKAPYKTIVIRVPEPIAASVQRFVDITREKLLKDEFVEGTSIQGEFPELRYSKLNYAEAVEEMNKIVKQRKSAKISMQKLLQVLYGDK
jgi:hypothetical protein